jgi:S-DNA-T family DNA segregation ATPase FtsK/SpoIIIE
MKARRRQSVPRYREEIFGILLMTFGALLLLSLLTYHASEQPDNVRLGEIKNWLGLAGVYLSYGLINFTIGYASLILPVLVILWGWNRFLGGEIVGLLRWSLYSFLLAVYASIILALPEVISPGASRYGFTLSGLAGGIVAQAMVSMVGVVGTVALLISLIVVTLLAATRTSITETFSGLARVLKSAAVGFGLRARYESWLAARRQAARRRSLGRPLPSRSRGATDGAAPRSPEAGPKTRRGWPSIQSPQIHTEESHDRGAELPEERVPPSEPVPMPQPTQETLFDRSPREPGPASRAKEPKPGVTEPPAGKRTPSPLPATPVRDVPPMEAYQFPPLELLAQPPTVDDAISKEELLANAQILEERLADFGVEGKVVEISPGPVITRYEVEPAPGVKVSRFTSLADDLALAMRAKRIRVLAPIPGKAAVGIEIPNRQPQTVYLRSIIDSQPFRESTSPLTIALGKTINGRPFVTDLAEMPHLLVAGATGSGKSVCLNTIIASILYKAHPTQVQFVMIDPKRLELSIYRKLRHHHLAYREDLDEEVVTNAQNAISVLRSVEAEMERRYDALASMGVRNIIDYNRRIQTGEARVMDDGTPFKPLPYLVVIIDELADLMLIAAKEVEEPIARLTQMSRAVGIHLIVATQRPSVDVITGVIKANFPARIAFHVAAKTDSRTILDMNGAEKLLGRGDMLFVPPGSAEAKRIHCAYISSQETETIIKHVARQPNYPKLFLPMLSEEEASGAGGFGDARMPGDRDVLFNEALKLVVRHQQGSISLLQRRLKVGYARAARLIDELEAAGVVGPFDGSKAREVLVTEDELEEMGLVD